MNNIENRLFREYRLKFYLNGSHFVIFNNKAGEVHPHTWEFTLTILISQENFVAFNVFERAIEKELQPYQNRVLNEVEPFTEIESTLENLVEYFGQYLKDIIREIGGLLVSFEGSETPTRSYIMYFNDPEDTREVDKYTNQEMEDVISSVLDDILLQDKE